MAGSPAPYTFDRVVRMVLSAAVLIGVFLLLRYLSDVLVPFAIAVVLAYLLNPLVVTFERLTHRRWLAVFLTLSGLVIVGTAVLILLIPLTIGQFERFRNDLRKLARDVEVSYAGAPPAEAVSAPESAPPAGEVDRVDASPEAVSEFPGMTFGWGELMEGWHEYRLNARQKSRVERLRDLRRRLNGTYLGQAVERTILYIKTELKAEDFGQMVFSALRRLAAGGWTVVMFAINFFLALTVIILILVYLIFLLIDYPEFAERWQGFLPPRYRETTVDFLMQFDAAMRQYFRGQSVVALLTGALYAIGFTIIGLPMAVPFGLFIGLLNMVPYLAAVSIVPGVLLALLRAIENDSSFLFSIVLLLLVYAVVQALQDTIITPKVMGRATGLRPIAILLGLFIWGKLLGFLGLILAIPMTCLGIAYYRRYILAPESTRIVPADALPGS